MFTDKDDDSSIPSTSTDEPIRVDTSTHLDNKSEPNEPIVRQIKPSTDD